MEARCFTWRVREENAGCVVAKLVLCMVDSDLESSGLFGRGTRVAKANCLDGLRACASLKSPTSIQHGAQRGQPWWEKLVR